MTYSPQVDPELGQLSCGRTGVAIISAERGAAPGPAWTAFFTDVSKISRRSARQGRSPPDELDRATQAAASKTLEKVMRHQRVLAGPILSGTSQTDPRRLTAIRTTVAGILRVSTADIQKAAQTYLKDSSARRLVVRPAAATTPAVASPAKP